MTFINIFGIQAPFTHTYSFIMNPLKSQVKNCAKFKSHFWLWAELAHNDYLSETHNNFVYSYYPWQGGSMIRGVGPVGLKKDRPTEN